jgi:hypothetical protein
MKSQMRLAAPLVALLFAACSTNSAGNKLPVPEVSLEQTSTMPGAAEYVTGGIPVSFRMEVTNRAAIPITLKRVDIVSVGEAGGYQVRQTTRPFNLVLAPGAADSVAFTVDAQNPGYNVTGSNEPVTIRVTSVYDSAEGTLQNIVIRQVSGIY